jgi:O-antigen ligase
VPAVAPADGPAPVVLGPVRQIHTKADWVYASLASLSVVGFPLISIVPAAVGIPSRPLSYVFRIGVLALALVVLARLATGRRTVSNRTALALMAGFALLVMLRVVWEASVRTFPLPLNWDEILAYATLVSILPAMALLQAPNKATLRLALVQTEAVGSVALVGLALLGVRSLGSAEAMTRLATEVLNPSSVGYLALTVLLVCTYRLATEVPRRIAPTVLRALLSGFALLVMVAAASKGPVLAAMLIGLLVVVSVATRRRSAVHAVGFAAILCVGGWLVWSAAQIIEDMTPLQTVSRFTGALADPSTSDRALLARSAFEQFASSPIIGSDLVERTLRAYPHNVLLEALLVTGILGFVPYLALNLIALRSAWRVLQARQGVGWVAMLHFEYQIAALLAGSLVYGAVSWAMLVLPIAAEYAVAESAGSGRQKQT